MRSSWYSESSSASQLNFLCKVHIVNLVTLPDGTKWMTDVGFGGDGATKPMPLVPRPSHP